MSPEQNNVKYINSDPNGLVLAPIGSIFYRNGENHYLIPVQTNRSERLYLGDISTFSRKHGSKEKYRLRKYEYASQYETWTKVGDSSGKTGWKFDAYSLPVFSQTYRILPTPIATLYFKSGKATEDISLIDYTQVSINGNTDLTNLGIDGVRYNVMLRNDNDAPMTVYSVTFNNAPGASFENGIPQITEFPYVIPPWNCIELVTIMTDSTIYQGTSTILIETNSTSGIITYSVGTTWTNNLPITPTPVPTTTPYPTNTPSPTSTPVPTPTPSSIYDPLAPSSSYYMNGSVITDFSVLVPTTSTASVNLSDVVVSASGDVGVEYYFTIENLYVSHSNVDTTVSGSFIGDFTYNISIPPIYVSTSSSEMLTVKTSIHKNAHITLSQLNISIGSSYPTESIDLFDQLMLGDIYSPFSGSSGWPQLTNISPWGNAYYYDTFNQLSIGGSTSNITSENWPNSTITFVPNGAIFIDETFDGYSTGSITSAGPFNFSPWENS